MALPFFYVQQLHAGDNQLDEDNSKHAINVLRMKKDDELMLTDGKGKKARAAIVDDNRKRTVTRIIETEEIPAPEKKVSIGISLVKNAARFEWFLEKATEIGVTEIIPLLCERTEREKFRFERMHSILVSALLQSQQGWLPLLHEPTEFAKAITKQADLRYIAHCLETDKRSLGEEYARQYKAGNSSFILIGPEGDFSEAEISLATAKGYQPVALGASRLRTETAGIVAATLLCI